MVTERLLITNEVGLHMRPAAIFANEMQKFNCEITIVFNDSRVNAKSILNIMTAGIQCGDEFVLECIGPDEQAAANKARLLIETNFAEEESE